LNKQPLILPSAAIVLRASHLVELRAFLLSKIMSKTAYTLQPMTKIEIFINEMNMITILETDQMMEQNMIILESKQRAQQVAQAILNLSEMATFERKKSRK
jgi:hypothetical protein